MHFTEYKFDRSSNKEFHKTLKQRVNQYFKENNISKKGNRKMVIKTLTMLSLLAIPYTIMLSGIFTSPLAHLALWFLMGIGSAGIGLSVMHDANHGAYSNNERVNKLLGYLMEFLGANSEIWKYQHNVLHHSYTNIDGADEDIDTPFILRFSPNKKHRAIHRYQHIHAWFFYQFMTIVKVIFTDFYQAAHYRKIDLIKSKKEFRILLFKIFISKILYLGYALALPLLFANVSIGLVIAGFFLMHAVISLTLAVIFQTAHVMPDSAYPQPDPEGMMEHDWAVHQLMTTSNYAPNNVWLTWFSGGLNFQIEHHLFSNICHVHYPSISEIVKKTATEFELPYQSRPTFRAAIADHARMLYQLGRPTQVRA